MKKLLLAAVAATALSFSAQADPSVYDGWDKLSADEQEHLTVLWHSGEEELLEAEYGFLQYTGYDSFEDMFSYVVAGLANDVDLSQILPLPQSLEYDDVSYTVHEIQTAWVTLTQEQHLAGLLDMTLQDIFNGGVEDWELWVWEWVMLPAGME